MAWFRRKAEDDSLDPTVLLARAEATAPPSGRFELTVKDVFTIAGRGTVVTGHVDAGHVQVGNAVQLVRKDGSTRELVLKGIEMFRKKTDSAVAGDEVGLLLDGVDRGDIARGDRLTR